MTVWSTPTTRSGASTSRFYRIVYSDRYSASRIRERTSEFQFVGGIRGHKALSKRVDRGDAMVAFHLYPTGMDQLFDVADADMLMPPKSTWFEPKLRGGVVLHDIK